ncbi:MAG: Qat anti-phage system QueC-like protein QatC [Candidatus Acidiferrales bacterium]|jgi:7-cyano-7-deazaguanine synthase in queuosine biosynthesis
MSMSVEFDANRRHEDGLALVTLSGPQVDDVEVDLPFRDLHRSLGTPNSMALELLLVAGACYAIDKVVSRRRTSDVWTRDLSVSFPVSDPKRWSKVSARLDTALTFLSGDVWRTSFRPTNCDLFVPPKRRRHLAKAPLEPKTFEAVSLFSGGLDSLIGTIDFLQEHPDRCIMLMGHYDSPGPKSQQRALYEKLTAEFPHRTKLVQVRVSQKPRKNVEPSLRSRSIIFLALGIYAASECGSDVPLIAPENGIIALNLPLTPSRIGSCSTRTMHPFYLSTFRSIVRDLGLKNKIVNPLELKTKGQCVAESRNLNFLRAVASRTVSCSHGTRRQEWKRKNAANCGYCVPCLFRRASLHAAQLDFGSEYGIDVCSDELTVASHLISADDIRALTSGLRQFTTDASIRRAITAVALVEPLDDYIALVKRGLSEIRTWIHDKGSASLREAAGIQKTGHA